MNETTVTIVGRVVNKPDLRSTANDVEIAKFRLASNERRYDRDSGQWVDGDSLYVNVTCWRRLAFSVHACLDKGDPVVVTGRLYTRQFEVDGQRRSMTELDATAIGPDLSLCTVNVHRKRASAAPAIDPADAAAVVSAAGEVLDAASAGLGAHTDGDASREPATAAA